MPVRRGAHAGGLYEGNAETLAMGTAACLGTPAGKKNTLLFALCSGYLHPLPVVV